MVEEEVFETFYRQTRDDLLRQTFLLTGDLPAATGAVKDAYAAAWHHWRKVVRREDPLDFVRPLAWRLAQRRHTTRLWHRNRALSGQQQRVLDALQSLGGPAKRALVLVALAGVDLRDAARELALTYDVARSRLDEAERALARELDVPVDQVPARLLDLAAAAGAAKLPRPSIILRAGRERRRLATVGSLAGAVALTLGLGAVTHDPGAQPAGQTHRLTPAPDATKPLDAERITATTSDQLLTGQDLDRLGLKRRWRVTRTDNNTGGDGLNAICQETRFADPHGLAALVRGFEPRGRVQARTLQAVEVSQTPGAARTTYLTTMGWFADCSEARLQLVSAYRVSGVGDEGVILKVRRWTHPVTTYSIAIARSGLLTTTTVTRSAGGDPPGVRRVAGLLSRAVELLCAPDETCAGKPRLSRTPPPPSQQEPGFVSVMDLPPVTDISRPWTAAASVPTGRDNPAATRCDRADFAGRGATRVRWRSFLVSNRALPKTFGLDETVGVFRTPQRATAFLAGVRRSVGACEDRDLTATVFSAHKERRPFPLSAWSFQIDISENAAVTFRVGVVRVGARVAQLTFIPARHRDMGARAFLALLHRAGERLRQLD